jgi:hypothetical protein
VENYTHTHTHTHKPKGRKPKVEIFSLATLSLLPGWIFFLTDFRVSGAKERYESSTLPCNKIMMEMNPAH